MRVSIFSSALVLATVMTFSSLKSHALTFSPTGPSQETVRHMRAEADPVFMAMQGLSGIGTGACEQESGVPFQYFSKLELKTKIFEYCMIVSGRTKEATNALKLLYPVGSKINGIYIYINYSGPVVIQ